MYVRYQKYKNRPLWTVSLLAPQKVLCFETMKNVYQRKRPHITIWFIASISYYRIISYDFQYHGTMVQSHITPELVLSTVIQFLKL